jgi:hypothetical protein
VSGLVEWAALRPFTQASSSSSAPAKLALETDLGAVVVAVDRLFEDRWTREQLEPAGRAEDLQVLRRVSLALVGTIPSLAEIREFESDSRPDRLRQWTIRYLADRRFADYFAERLAIAFAGQFEQKVPYFSHARFEAWIADQLAAGRPYDQWVRDMIGQSGPPTSNRGANFVTAEIVQGEQYANRLAARTARAFLGQRIDCAECHDHPFDDWKQADFQGLAAYFAQVRTRSVGVEDDADLQHEVEDRKTLEKQVIEPRVPFHEEWLGEHDSRRGQLADWLTHDDNRRFYRAIANRVWGLVFGRPLISPVDALPDPPETTDSPDAAAADSTDLSDVLDLLADDLREHGGDLRRLILVIMSARPFQLASTHPRLEAESSSNEEMLQDTWGVFPLVRLRPEQLARSLEQAGSLRTITAGDNVWTLIRRELWMRKFAEQYGALDENELEESSDTIPQTIHRMHSRFTREQSRAGWLSAAGRITATTSESQACLESCYLVCLTRRPTDVEREHFLGQLDGANANRRGRVVEDIFWTLFNSPEFEWNH